MCLVLVAHQILQDCPLLVLANRDEYYDRPTAPVQAWQEAPGMLAGRDLVAGGTWLGTRHHRWAAVTNVREGGPAPPPLTRLAGQGLPVWCTIATRLSSGGDGARRPVCWL